MSVRQFSNTIETGVGTYITIPIGTTNMVFNFKGRAQTAPGVVSVIQPILYTRLIPVNAAIGTWATVPLDVMTIPTNTYMQAYAQTFSLSSMGIVADALYLIELTLSTSPASGVKLAGNWLMNEFTIAFT
jgi:hypothetical protein